MFLSSHSETAVSFIRKAAFSLSALIFPKSDFSLSFTAYDSVNTEESNTISLFADLKTKPSESSSAGSAVHGTDRI